jgi:glycerate kinase
MNVLICSDAFKACMSAATVSAAIQEGIRDYDPQIRCTTFPMADGGEGSIDVIAAHVPLLKVSHEVKDPLFRKITTQYATSGDTAYIELSNASGYALLHKNERNPMYTSSIGTGELIGHALAEGARHIFLFLGGSATNDAGIGIAHALGYRFLDEKGTALLPVGGRLREIATIVTPEKEWRDIRFTILSDVKNPLFGPEGAAYTYGPQKGASSEEVEWLDAGLQHFADLVYKTLQVDIATIPGGGAAGGIAAGMYGLFNATIERGFDCIAKITGIEAAIIQSDLIISGEGQLDHQSFQGKLINGISDICAKHKKKLMLIVGNNILSKSEWQSHGISEVYAVTDMSRDIDDAIAAAPGYIRILASHLIQESKNF